MRGGQAAPPAEGTGAVVFCLPQVPYETLNKRFRAAQKNIDRETSHVTMVVAELEKTLSGCPAVDSVVSLLDGVVEKLSVLKRKVSALPGCAACPAPSRGHLQAPPSPPAPGGAVAEGGPHPLLLCAAGGSLPDPPSSQFLSPCVLGPGWEQVYYFHHFTSQQHIGFLVSEDGRYTPKVR